jgi:hypothetical protein
MVDLWNVLDKFVIFCKALFLGDVPTVFEKAKKLLDTFG